MTTNLMMFVFNHPVDFPYSEYGGLWVVRAHNARQAAKLAWDACDEMGVDTGDSLPKHLEEAAEKGQCFMLKTFPEDVPCVLNHFIT